MIQRKKSAFTVAVLFGITLNCHDALKSCDCGFDAVCPNSTSPCYKVMFSVVKYCGDGSTNETYNPYMLKF